MDLADPVTDHHGQVRVRVKFLRIDYFMFFLSQVGNILLLSLVVSCIELI